MSQMRSFLGLCNVNKFFVIGLAKIAAPLNMQLEKEKSLYFKLNEKKCETIQKLKKKLLSLSVVAVPR